jgi:asparagine synthase (glutamine-hydrolysing)
MCGICGVVALGRPAERETVAAMARELDHRGPDGRGSFADDAGVALGFRRLAIIDLSDAGNQPFASDDGALQLLHNGEIYDYRELRGELESHGHRFRSATDTEVVLRAYEQWGDACVRRFNGMWAIALWDARRRRLFCSRDRFGIKPFVYSWDGSRFAFASEPKAFRGDRATRLEANPRAVREYVEQGYTDHTDETFFSGVLRLPPAHNLVVDDRGLRTERYWSLEERDAPADPAEAVRETFVDALRIHLRSDVPVGTCLSGGIDSSAIACGVDLLLHTEAENAKPVGERQKTFTAYFELAGFDERPYARAVVAQTRAEPHWISFGDHELVNELPHIVEAQDEPFGSTSIVAQWHVMRAAREAGLTVMLDGQGADEILAGYHGFFGPFFADLLVHGRLRELRREVAAYRTLHGAGAATAAVALARPFLPERVRRLARARSRGSAALLHPSLRAHAPAPEANGAPYGDHLRRQLHLILTSRGLPELLRYEDRNSMAHSLEARVPFLDHRLVELMFSLRATELIERGRTKAVLRRALGDILPPVVRDRNDKLGFVTPEQQWLRGRLGELAGDVFASQSFRERGWIDADAARTRLERHRRGELDAGFELWRALNVELWARMYL